MHISVKLSTLGSPMPLLPSTSPEVYCDWFVMLYSVIRIYLYEKKNFFVILRMKYTENDVTRLRILA